MYFQKSVSFLLIVTLLIITLSISDALPVHFQLDPSCQYKRGEATIVERVNKKRSSLSMLDNDFDLYVAKYALRDDNVRVKRKSSSSLHKALKRDVDLDEIDWSSC